MEKCCDRISNLPESIRNYIISFLPTLDAVRTSVLSKQWRNVCSSLPNLWFDQHYFYQIKSNFSYCISPLVPYPPFINFVNQTLSHHDESNIDKFSLHIGVWNYDNSFIHSWISFAVRHNVKDLSLQLRLGKLYPLPCCLFKCKTLTNLKLHKMSLKAQINIAGFPTLKKLELFEVIFRDGSQINQLISDCLLLEDLTITSCSWKENAITILVISAPNLKTLSLKHIFPCHEFKISAVSLRQLDYNGGPPCISPNILSSLLHTKLEYIPPAYIALSDTSREVFARRVSKILIELQNVVTLSISCWCFEFLAEDRDLLSHLPASCPSLRDLNLTAFATKNQVQVITTLLRSYPNLQSLRIDFKELHHISPNMLNMEEYWQSRHLSTNGTLKHLKTIKLKQFTGSYYQLELVKYLLENSDILETMEIMLPYPEHVNRQMKKFALFAKASPNVKISFLQLFSTQGHPAVQGFDPWSFQMMGSQGLDTTITVGRVDEDIAAQIAPDYTDCPAPFRDRYTDMYMANYAMQREIYDQSQQYYQYLEAERQRTIDAMAQLQVSQEQKSILAAQVQAMEEAVRESRGRRKRRGGVGSSQGSVPGPVEDID